MWGKLKLAKIFPARDFQAPMNATFSFAANLPKSRFPCRWKFNWNSIWLEKGLNQRKQEAHRTSWQQTHLRQHLRSINFIKNEFLDFPPPRQSFFADIRNLLPSRPHLCLFFYFHTSNIFVFSSLQTPNGYRLGAIYWILDQFFPDWNNGNGRRRTAKKLRESQNFYISFCCNFSLLLEQSKKKKVKFNA